MTLAAVRRHAASGGRDNSSTPQAVQAGLPLRVERSSLTNIARWATRGSARSGPGRGRSGDRLRSRACAGGPAVRTIPMRLERNVTRLEEQHQVRDRRRFACACRERVAGPDGVWWAQKLDAPAVTWVDSGCTEQHNVNPGGCPFARFLRGLGPRPCRTRRLHGERWAAPEPVMGWRGQPARNARVPRHTARRLAHPGWPSSQLGMSGSMVAFSA